MSYRYLQSIDRMCEEIEETWTVRDLIDTLKATRSRNRLRFNLDTVIHEVATHIYHAHKRDIEEARAECQAQ